MQKKNLLPIIISISILLGSTNVWALPEKAHTPKVLVKNYLEEKMEVIVTHNLDALDKYFSKLDAKAGHYLLFVKIHILQDFLLSYSENSLTIERIAPKVRLLHIECNQNECYVTARLKSDIFWNASNALGPPLKGTISEMHNIKLIKEGDYWRIVCDKFQSDHQNSELCENTSADNLGRALASLKDKFSTSHARSKESPPAKLQLVPRLRSDKERNKLYNRDEAYNWAKTYWKNYSDRFINLGDEAWEGGDCTNFVSQCIKAGGAENDMQGSFKWYYIRNGKLGNKADNFSWTWSTARGLNSILLGNFRKNEFGPQGIEKVLSGDSSYTSELGEFVDIGDILQYEFEAGKGIKHSAIVVGKIYNSEAKSYQPVISTHSFDSWNLPWTKNAYKTHFVHITGIN